MPDVRAKKANPSGGRVPSWQSSSLTVGNPHHTPNTSIPEDYGSAYPVLEKRGRSGKWPSFEGQRRILGGAHDTKG